MKNRRAVILLGLVAVALTACATTVRSVPPDFKPGADSGTVVLGRIEVVRADTGAALWKGSTTPALEFLSFNRFRLTAKHENTGRRYVIDALEMGPLADFNVVLPPGRYRLDGIRAAGMEFSLKATMDVPTAPVVYVGTLRYTGKQAHFGLQILGVAYRGRWTVEDTSESVIERFRQRNPRMIEAVVPAPMAFATVVQSQD